MASTYTALGVELMATGENAGTWGTKTNTNLNIIEQISGGYYCSINCRWSTNYRFSVSDGSTGASMAHRMIEFTGSISGNQIVTIPLDAQTFYFLRNSTSGAYTVQFKYILVQEIHLLFLQQIKVINLYLLQQMMELIQTFIL
jgi:hypothetical protein